MADGGSTVGSADMPVSIPAGAHVLATQVKVLAGFIGDTSATIQVGDGTDVDRYTTGTPSVFTTAPEGVDVGVPSGVRYHTAAKTPKVTITSGSDWGLVTAGEVEVVIAFLEFGI